MTTNAYLPMYPELMEAIRKGKKSLTIRKGFKLGVNVGPALIVSTDDKEGFVPVFIYSVEVRRFRSLDDFDAVKEGYEHASDLKKSLLKIYPELTLDDWVTVISFRTYEPAGFLDTRVSARFRQEMINELIENVEKWETDQVYAWVKQTKRHFLRFETPDQELLKEYHESNVSYETQMCPRGEDGKCFYCEERGIRNKK